MYARLTLTAFFWAGAFFSVKAVIERIPVYGGAFLRFAIAGLFLTGVMFAYANRPSFRTMKEKADLLFLAFFGILLYNLFFFAGLKLTTPVNGSLIVAANPAITALISQLWRKESSSPARWFGIFVSFTGLLIVFSRGSAEVLLTLSFNPGDLFLTGSSICWALYSIKGKEVLIHKPVIGTTALACLTGSVMLLPVALLEWFMPDLMWYNSFARESFVQPAHADFADPVLWLNLLYLGIFASGFAFLFWYQGVRALGAPRTAVFINLVPVFAMMISAALGSFPEPYQLPGAAIVILGVYLTNRFN